MDYLSWTYTGLGPGQLLTSVLREPANIARPHFLLPLKACDNCGRSPLAEERKCYAHLKGKKGDLEICSLVSITSIPRKIMEQILLEVFSMVRKGQRGGTVIIDLSRLCSTIFSSFCDQITNSVDMESAVDII